MCAWDLFFYIFLLRERFLHVFNDATEQNEFMSK